MEKIKQFAAFCIMTSAFWGVLYPEFSLGKDTYLYVETAGSIQVEEQNPEADLWHILEADRENLVVKSKLLEWLQESVFK